MGVALSCLVEGRELYNRNMKKSVVSLLAALCLSACGTAPVPTTQNSAPPAIALSLPASSFPVLTRFTFTATLGPADAYLYAFFVDAQGGVAQLLPNRYDSAPGDVSHPAGEVVTFPPADARYYVLTDGTTGPATLLAFVSTAPLNLGAVSAYEGQNPFATAKVSGLEPLSAALKVAADSLPGTLYAETRAAFTVTAP